MGDYSEKQEQAIRLDLIHNRLVYNFLSVKAATDVELFEKIGPKRLEGTLASAVLVLFEGMKISQETLHMLRKESAQRRDVAVPHLNLLVDKNLSGVPTKGIGNGYIFTASPDRRRTEIIKRWCYEEHFEEDKHGAGFQQAVEFVSMVTADHIRTYQLFSRALGYELTHNPMVDKINGQRDWEGVWVAYNELVYGRKINTDVTLRLREACRSIGLDNKKSFENLARRGSKACLALSALDLVKGGYTR